MDEDLLKQVFEAVIGKGTKRTYKDYRAFSDLARYAESRNKDDAVSPGGKYIGPLQYSPESKKTAIQRWKNIAKEVKMSDELLSKVLKQVDKKVGDMSYEDQALLMFADLHQRPEAPLQSWLQGKASDFDLYYKGHHTTSSDATFDEDQVKKNWENTLAEYDRFLKKNKKKVDITQNLPPDVSVTGRTEMDYRRDFGKLPGEVLKPVTGFKDMYERLYDISVNPNMNTESLYALGGSDTEDPIKLKETKDMKNSKYKNLYGFGGPDLLTPIQGPSMGFDVQMGIQAPDISGLSAPLGGIAGSSGIGSLLGNSNPIGIASSIAGVASGVIDAFKKDPTASDNYSKDVGLGSYDFGAKYSRGQGAKYKDALQKKEAVVNSLGSIPIVGSFVKLGNSLADVTGLTGLLGPKKMDAKEQLGDYISSTRADYLDQRRSAVNSSSGIAAYGGEYPNADTMADKIEVGGTHEENPMKGVKFSENQDGSNNLAEEGEVIWKDPKKGINYVFSNKLFL